MITCYPSSVSMACFVTAGAIHLKLGTYVPLGQVTSQNNFQSDLILGHQGAKTQKVLSITP
jgi:hypothetical protein